MWTACKGRTHGCTDQACDVKILLANPEPSTHGPKRASRRVAINVRFVVSSGLLALTKSLSVSDPTADTRIWQCRAIGGERAETAPPDSWKDLSEEFASR